MDRKEVIELLIRTCNGNFKLTDKGRDVYIYPKTREHHEAICKVFEGRNYSFHSFGFKNDKPKKFVLHGLPASFSSEKIKADLLSNMNVLDVHQYTKMDKVTELKRKLPVFTVLTDPGTNSTQLRSIRTILYHTFRVEKYSSKGQPSQCYRCQDSCQVFGHASYHCRPPLKCVRCAFEHNIKECPRKDRPKCVNCRGNHVARYRQCPQRIKYASGMAKKQMLILLQRPQHQRNVTRKKPQYAQLPLTAHNHTRAPGCLDKHHLETPKNTPRAFNRQISNTRNMISEAELIFTELDNLTFLTF